MIVSYFYAHCIGGVTVSMLVTSAVDHGFKPWLGQTIDCKIGSSLSMQHLRVRKKIGLALHQDNVSEWSNMSTHGLCQWVSNIKIQLTVLTCTKQTSSSSSHILQLP